MQLSSAIADFHLSYDGPPDMQIHVRALLTMKEKVSKLTYPTLQHCLRMMHIKHTTIMKGGIGQSGSKPF